MREAALVGMFDPARPDRPAGASGGEAVRSGVLVLDRGKGLWRMRLNEQREQLAALPAAPSPRDAALAQAAPLPGDDRAAFLAHALRAGRAIPLAEVAERYLPALLDVAIWLSGLDIAFPDPRGAGCAARAAGGLPGHARAARRPGGGARRGSTRSPMRRPSAASGCFR